MKSAVLVLMSLVLEVPAFGNTHKNTYPVPCGKVWSAVRDTLGNPDNYAIVLADDAKMTASYTIKGAVRERTNSVVLVPKGDSKCEMQVQSSYSGWVHDDAGDFKKRVDDSLAKQEAAKHSEPAKPTAPK